MDYSISRKRMVEEQLKKRKIFAPQVLKALGKIPRHIFVEDALKSQAYGDFPLGIGRGQTISQPYIVALMTQSLQLKGDEKVLEIGTGCGYQTSILAEIVNEVYTIERIEELFQMAKRNLIQLGYKNVTLKLGDGSLGWPEKAPYDAILAAAGSPEIPQPLLDQLKEGGRLVVPVGNDFSQNLLRLRKENNQIIRENLGPCRFVKMIGSHAWQGPRQIGENFKKRSIF